MFHEFTYTSFLVKKKVSFTRRSSTGNCGGNLGNWLKEA